MAQWSRDGSRRGYAGGRLREQSRGVGQAQDNSGMSSTASRGRATSGARACGIRRRKSKTLGGNGARVRLSYAVGQLSALASPPRARFKPLIAKREVTRRGRAPVPASECRRLPVNGENASEYSNMVHNGLMRVTLPLPQNVRLLDSVTGQPTDETSTDLSCMIPVMNVTISVP